MEKDDGASPIKSNRYPWTRGRVPATWDDYAPWVGLRVVLLLLYEFTLVGQTGKLSPSPCLDDRGPKIGVLRNTSYYVHSSDPLIYSQTSTTYPLLTHFDPASIPDNSRTLEIHYLSITRPRVCEL